MPTEEWVRWMMDKAGLDGLIDPKDFVCFQWFADVLGRAVRRGDEESCSDLQEAERRRLVDSLLL